MMKKIISLVIGASLCLGCCGCVGNSQKSEIKTVEAPPSDGWSCIFMASAQPSQIDMLPKNPHLSDSTVRHQFRASMSGSKIRLTFSNEYSDSLEAPGEPLEIKSVHVAKLAKAGEPNIIAETDTVVTFGGEAGVSIPSGETVTSDEIDFEFSALDFIAVTSEFGSVPACPAVHQEGDCGSWVVAGEHASENFNPTEWMWSYFSFCRADGYSEGSETLVCFGDSITDGSISTWNGFDAWPDILMNELQNDSETKNISVVNAGIGGNAIWGGSGLAAKDRIVRDAVEIPGVRNVIILIGTNDIPGAQTDTSEDMIKEYKAMIEKCHEKGIKIYAGTVTPFGGNEWWSSDLHEDIRTKINAWMMSDESGFDGYIDFAAAVRDPDEPTRLKAEFDSGDGLHPSVNGHKAMGEAAAEAMKKYFLK